MTLVGAGYRAELNPLFVEGTRSVECAELVANRYFGEGGFARAWELELLEGLPIAVHGLSGNFASATGPEAGYFAHIRTLCDAINTVAYSDHLAFTAARDLPLGHLAPNLFDEELLDLSARHISTAASLTGRRPRLENLATTTMITGSTYNPEEFYLRLLDRSDEWDCLFDLTNVWINSQNRPVDPIEIIDAIPVGRIQYVHLAGGHLAHGQLIDSHSQQVHPEAIELLGYVLERESPEVIIIERDSNWDGAIEQVQEDLETVKSLVRRCEAQRQAIARPA